MQKLLYLSLTSFNEAAAITLRKLSLRNVLIPLKNQRTLRVLQRLTANVGGILSHQVEWPW